MLEAAIIAVVWVGSLAAATVVLHINHLADLASAIAEVSAEVEAREAAAYKAGGEEALLHALHPEFGSIYDVDGEATAAFNQGRHEGIEAAARICDERSDAEMQTLLDGQEYYRTHADRLEALRCASAIRALPLPPCNH